MSIRGAGFSAAAGAASLSCRFGMTIPVPATLISDSEILCSRAPAAQHAGPVRVQISGNGQDFFGGTPVQLTYVEARRPSCTSKCSPTRERA